MGHGSALDNCGASPHAQRLGARALVAELDAVFREFAFALPPDSSSAASPLILDEAEEGGAGCWLCKLVTPNKGVSPSLELP